MRHLAVLTLLAALGVVAGRAAAQGTECAALADMRLEATNLLSATEVAAEGELPRSCRILGYVRPAISFEVRLPTDDWNGKFYMVGCGGFCGQLESDAAGFINAMNYGLARGYAVATMDGGHWGRSSADGRWAKADPVAEVDWGWRAVDATTRVVKALTRAYYPSAPEYSYFAGCSTGGRRANMAALRQPEDFDGIISGAPVLDYPGVVGTAFAWIVEANTGADGVPIVTPDDVPVVREAALAACDGAEDGMISEPRACDFEPASLACGDGADGQLLSSGKVSVPEKWYRPARASGGAELYPGAKSVAYYQALASAAGGMDAAQDFARLFMIPGMDHCGLHSGPGSGRAVSTRSRRSRRASRTASRPPGRAPPSAPWARRSGLAPSAPSPPRRTGRAKAIGATRPPGDAPGADGAGPLPARPRDTVQQRRHP